MNPQFRPLCLFGVFLLPFSTVLPEEPVSSSSVIPTLMDDWGNIHNQSVAEARARAEKINIVFAGDSISARWTLGAGRDIWAKRYAPLGAINLSISADNAQHLLWRLENGELASLHPKMFILLKQDDLLPRRQPRLPRRPWRSGFASHSRPATLQPRIFPTVGRQPARQNRRTDGLPCRAEINAKVAQRADAPRAQRRRPFHELLTLTPLWGRR